MINGIDNAFDLFVSSFKIFWKYPVLIIPIFIVWMVYAPMLIYMKWHFPWDHYNLTGQLIFLYLFIYIIALLLTFSCSILLELIQQYETGNKFNFWGALNESLTKNIAHIVILAILWSFIWFVLVFIQMILSKKKSNSDDKTTENIARTLAGHNEYSFWSSSIEMIKKGVRMAVFLIMPSSAWEDLGLRDSYKRGMQILRQRKTAFIAGFSISFIINFLLFFYPSMMFLMSKNGVEFSEMSWYVCILYIGIAWSYSIYLEQMFAAELYLWQMKYEKEVAEAKRTGDKIPEFNDIKRPFVLDEIPDLIE